MSKLSNIKIYAIKWLHSQNYSISEIAKEIKVSSSQIQEVVKSPDNVPQVQQSPVAKNLMITHTSGKKINNVAIMTKEASSVVDSIRKSATNNSTATHNNSIYRHKK